jgi:acid phosphatase type 7
MSWLRRPLLVLAIGVTVSALAAPAGAQDPVIAAAGDIACDPADPVTSDTCHQQATSNLLVGAGLAAVLPLGDIQYDSASYDNILGAYHPTWGRVKDISHPVLGNHETSGTGYFDYFNGVGVSDGPAGTRGEGWYSFDVGTWHLVALNSNCTRPGDTSDTVDCDVGSEQESWLRADLAAHPASCTLAFWHHPRYSSGHDGSNTFTQAFWDALQDAQAEIVLSGHSHDYERFAPLDRNGNPDPGRGIRQFVVGTGGAFFTGLSSQIANSEVAQHDTFGVLKLTLRPDSYSWTFVPEAGKTFTDSGTTMCHGLVAGPPPPASGPPPPASGPPPLDTVAPNISGLKLINTRFRVDRTGTSATAKRGTTFLYSLSEVAVVRFTIERRSKGRLVDGRCRRPTRKNRDARACIRYTRVGSFRRSAAAGANKTKFRGKVGRRWLRRGPYRATLRATDGAENRSRRKRVRFKVVRS